MNAPIRLFDLPDLRADEPEPPAPSYGRRLTARNNRTIERNLHPATLWPLLRVAAPSCELRCRDCAHAFPTGRGRKTFWKCAKNIRGLTRGPRTDIRLKWPACGLFERRPTEEPHERDRGTGTGDAGVGDDAVDEG